MLKICMQIQNVGVIPRKNRKRPQLRQLNAEMIDDGAHVIGLIETGFKPMLPTDTALEEVFNDFIVHRLDYSGVGHGLALFVRKNIFDSVTLLEEEEEMEQIWIELRNGSNNVLILCLCYCAPNKSFGNCLINRRLGQISKNHKKFNVKMDNKKLCIMGDLNLRMNYNNADGKPNWYSSEMNYKVISDWEKLLNECDFVQCNPNKFGGCTIDIFLFNGPINDVRVDEKRKFFQKNGPTKMKINDSHRNLQFTVNLFPLSGKKEKLMEVVMCNLQLCV